jgi:hypothetical protein
MEKEIKVFMALSALDWGFAQRGRLSDCVRVRELADKFNRIKNNPPALRAWSRKAKEIIAGL